MWVRTPSATPTWINDAGAQLIANTATPWAVTLTPVGGTAVTLIDGADAAHSLALAEKIIAASHEELVDPTTL